MDCGFVFYIWVGKGCDNNFIEDVFGYFNFVLILQKMIYFLELDIFLLERVRFFIIWFRDSRLLSLIFYIVKDESFVKVEFFQYLIEDWIEVVFFYYEFLFYV